MTKHAQEFTRSGGIVCPNPACRQEIPLLNAGPYKLGASGAGIVVFEVLSPTTIRLLLSLRTSVVGEGLGITGGGYVELAAIARKKNFTIIDTAEEAFRENKQENLGFKALFSIETFLAAAQPVAQLQVSTPKTKHDKSGVHTTNFYGINTTSETFAKIAALKGNEERSGALIEAVLDIGGGAVSRRTPENDLSLTVDGRALVATDFYHRHELRAIALIGWHLQEGYLRRPI